MSGIVGSFGLGQAGPVPKGLFDEGLVHLTHRGADQAYRAMGRCQLGIRYQSERPSTNAWPVTSADGRYMIIMDGTLFNADELHERFNLPAQDRGCSRQASIVLAAYLHSGLAGFKALNGAFAVAIHDAQKDELLLVRDHFGKKPLLWVHTEDRLLFASELRALIKLGASLIVDPVSTRQLLTYSYIPAPHSAVHAVRKLLPGTALLVDVQGAKQMEWYDTRSFALPGRPSERVASPGPHLKALLEDAVERRIDDTEGPVGCFLSGGVDSSIISLLASQHIKHLPTFSIGYSDAKFFDESRYAEEVARHIGSEHTTFMFDLDELAEAYVRLLAILDEPYADSSAIAAYALNERVGQEVAVALGGDGADEIFGGYHKHQAELRWRHPGLQETVVKWLAPLWHLLPQSRDGKWQDRFRQLDRFATLAGLDEAARYLGTAAFTPPATVERLLSDQGSHASELAERNRAMTDPLKEVPGINGVLLADVRSTLVDDMLRKVDLTSQVHGLHVRTPFLDHRVVEFAFSLPPTVKLRKGSGKHVLRTTFGASLPENVMKRRKRGFEVPLADLFRGPLAGLVERTFQPDALSQAGFNPTAVAHLVDRLHSHDPGTSQATIHALLVHIAWWKAMGP